MTHVLLVPSEYPTSDHKLGGIFTYNQEILLKKKNKIGVIYIYLFSIKKLFCLLNKISRNFILNKKFYLYFPRIPYLKKMNYYIHFFFFSKIFKSYVKINGKPDLLHVHFSEFSIWTAYQINRIYKIPYVITEHSTDFLDLSYQKKYKKKTKLYQMMHLSFSNAKKIICVSQELKNSIKNHYELSNSKITVIPNIVKTLKKKNTGKVYDFIFIGTLDERKNPFLALEAIKIIQKKIKKIKFLIIGNGALKKKIQNFIKKNNLHKNIKLISSIPNDKVLLLISKSKILISTSLFETFGVVIVEAYSLGVPVIMTDAIGNRSLYNKNCSILLKKKNTETLVQSMFKTLKNYKKIKKRKIISFYKKNFSNYLIISKINKIYKSI